MTFLKFRGYNRIKFPSRKLGTTVFCNSLLLRDYLIHLEWDDNVKTFSINPLKISYCGDIKNQLFKPQLLLTDQNDQKTVVWLKSSIEDENKHLKFVKLIKNICHLNDLNFLVKTAAEVRKEPLFSNLKLLRRYSRLEITIEQTLLCNDFFEKLSSPRLRDLIKFLIARRELKEISYALLFNKIIGADLHQDFLNEDTQINHNLKFPAFKNGRIAS